MASRPTDDLGAISTLVCAALAGPKPPVQRNQVLHRGPDSSRPCLQGPSFRHPPLSGRRSLPRAAGWPGDDQIRRIPPRSQRRASRNRGSGPLYDAAVLIGLDRLPRVFAWFLGGLSLREELLELPRAYLSASEGHGPHNTAILLEGVLPSGHGLDPGEQEALGHHYPDLGGRYLLLCRNGDSKGFVVAGCHHVRGDDHVSPGRGGYGEHRAEAEYAAHDKRQSFHLLLLTRPRST